MGQAPSCCDNRHHPLEETTLPSAEVVQKSDQNNADPGSAGPPDRVPGFVYPTWSLVEHSGHGRARPEVGTYWELVCAQPKLPAISFQDVQSANLSPSCPRPIIIPDRLDPSAGAMVRDLLSLISSEDQSIGRKISLTQLAYEMDAADELDASAPRPSDSLIGLPTDRRIQISALIANLIDENWSQSIHQTSETEIKAKMQTLKLTELTAATEINVTEPLEAMYAEQISEVTEESAMLQITLVERSEWFKGKPTSTATDAEMVVWISRQPAHLTSDPLTASWFAGQPSSSATDTELCDWFTAKQPTSAEYSATVSASKFIIRNLRRADVAWLRSFKVVEGLAACVLTVAEVTQLEALRASGAQLAAEDRVALELNYRVPSLREKVCALLAIVGLDQTLPAVAHVARLAKIANLEVKVSYKLRWVLASESP